MNVITYTQCVVCRIYAKLCISPISKRLVCNACRTNEDCAQRRITNPPVFKGNTSRKTYDA